MVALTSDSPTFETVTHVIACTRAGTREQPTFTFTKPHRATAKSGQDRADYYHRTQQYSINAVTTSAGAIAERYAYSAYGEPTICNASGSVLASSAINNRYSYTGREWDATVGLHHFRARWMSPKTGRFLGRDPIDYEGSQWGLYEYVGGGSLTFTDPSGEAAAVIPAMGGIVIIAGTALVVSAAVQAYCISNPDQCKIRLPRLPRIRRIPWPWSKPKPKPLSPDPPLPPPPGPDGSDEPMCNCCEIDRSGGAAGTMTGCYKLTNCKPMKVSECFIGAHDDDNQLPSGNPRFCAAPGKGDGTLGTPFDPKFPPPDGWGLL